MTTSGTTTYALNANQIIEKAFHRLGKAGEGEAMTARMYEDGRSSLNLLLKDLGAEQHLWTKAEGTLALVASQAGYTLTTISPLRILSIRRRADSLDTEMEEISREDYFNMPNKTVSPSTPVSWYFDPQRAAGVLYVWPAPDATAATDNVLYVTYLRRIEDMTATNDDIDLPQEWLQGIIWALADDLETEYPVNDPRLAVKIERKSIEFMTKMRAWDTEMTPVFMQPDLCA